MQARNKNLVLMQFRKFGSRDGWLACDVCVSGMIGWLWLNVQVPRYSIHMSYKMLMRNLYWLEMSTIKSELLRTHSTD